MDSVLEHENRLFKVLPLGLRACHVVSVEGAMGEVVEESRFLWQSSRTTTDLLQGYTQYL